MAEASLRGCVRLSPQPAATFYSQSLFTALPCPPFMRCSSLASGSSLMSSTAFESNRPWLTPGSSKTRTLPSTPSCRWGAVEHRGRGVGVGVAQLHSQVTPGFSWVPGGYWKGRQEWALRTPELYPGPLQWCEKHKRSGRQTLGDLLIKPHQRITKYPLLLQAVLKRSPEPRAREALTAMVGIQVGLGP